MRGSTIFPTALSIDMTSVVRPADVHRSAKSNAEPDQEVEMAPGDVLFIPRGEPHSAAVSSKHSVHLTISLISQTENNFFRHLRKEAAKDPLLRMDLPRHSSDEEARAHEAHSSISYTN
jgi:ribosomal protein L16 Arg81 hydroxylase